MNVSGPVGASVWIISLGDGIHLWVYSHLTHSPTRNLCNICLIIQSILLFVLLHTLLCYIKCLFSSSVSSGFKRFTNWTVAVTFVSPRVTWTWRGNVLGSNAGLVSGCFLIMLSLHMLWLAGKYDRVDAWIHVQRGFIFV